MRDELASFHSRCPRDIEGVKRAVSCRIGGRWVRGSFTISDEMVHVEYEHFSRSTQIGGSPPLVIARLVLRELIADTHPSVSPPTKARPVLRLIEGGLSKV